MHLTVSEDTRRRNSVRVFNQVSFRKSGWGGLKTTPATKGRRLEGLISRGDIATAKLQSMMPRRKAPR